MRESKIQYNPSLTVKENVISIGDSIVDKQMSDNGGVKFYGAL